eukprot:TCONS_00036879-protein
MRAVNSHAHQIQAFKKDVIKCFRVRMRVKCDTLESLSVAAERNVSATGNLAAFRRSRGTHSIYASHAQEKVAQPFQPSTNVKLVVTTFKMDNKIQRLDII